MNENENVIAQQRPGLTHFLSIPINDKNIVEKFMDFKKEVALMNDAEITDSHFQKAYKLHLTLGVLSLLSDEEMNSAKVTLDECRDIIDKVKTRFNNPGDLRIKIEDIACMRSTPPNCRILYGKVESELLQTIVHEIVAHFISKGLIEEDKHQVILHVTIMNVAYAKRKEGKRLRKFDASAIMENFSNYNFGEQKISELHLSRFATAGEVYQSAAVLNIS